MDFTKNVRYERARERAERVVRASGWYPAATAEQARRTLQLLSGGREDASITSTPSSAGKAKAKASPSASRASLRYWAYCYLSVIVYYLSKNFVKLQI